MATYQITALENFNSNWLEEWPCWIQKFENFCQASGLSKKEEANQANAFIYTMGDTTDNILSLLGLTDEEKANYDIVKAKFQAYFIKNVDVIYE